MTGQTISIPPNVQSFSASGSNADELQDRLFKESQGQELFYQTVENEDGTLTVYGFPRAQVLDLIYERAYPVVNDMDCLRELGVEVLGANLLREDDKVRHNSPAAAAIAIELARKGRERRKAQ